MIADELLRDKGVFGEEKLEMIDRIYKAGLEEAMVGLIIQPNFCAEQMDVLLNGAQNGLSYDQVSYVADSKGDWMEMETILIGFQLGMSVGEMEETLDSEEGYSLLDRKIEGLLDKFTEEKAPIADRILSSYMNRVQAQETSPEAERLQLVFCLKYDNEGYRYSGAISKSEIDHEGCGEDAFQELLEKGIILRRDCQKEMYELSIPERYFEIRKQNALSEWEKNGGDFFRLNNGYNGEFQRVLRGMLHMEQEFQEKQPYRIAVKEILVKEVEIYANSPKEAEEMALNLHTDGEIVLDYDNFADVETEYRGGSRPIDLELHEVYGKEGSELKNSLEEKIQSATKACEGANKEKGSKVVEKEMEI